MKATCRIRKPLWKIQMSLAQFLSKTICISDNIAQRNYLSLNIFKSYHALASLVRSRSHDSYADDMILVAINTPCPPPTTPRMSLMIQIRPVAKPPRIDAIGTSLLTSAFSASSEFPCLTPAKVRCVGPSKSPIRFSGFSRQSFFIIDNRADITQ